MTSGRRSIDAELIRYRLEKRMAGRRDLLIHLLVYVGIALLFRVNFTWYSALDYSFLAGFWAIPLAVHGLRYYYRCGPGARKRADEIERAIDEQASRTDLDEDEELLVEERASKRITARRIWVGHVLTSALFVLLYTLHMFSIETEFPFYFWRHIIQIFTLFGGAVVLHSARFFFVHGRTPVGRAIKIDAAIEREWHQSREQSRLRRGLYEAEAESRNLGELHGRRLRLSDEGEFKDDIEAGSSGAGRAANIGRAGTRL